MRFTVTVGTGGQRCTMTVPAAVAAQIEEAAKATGRGTLSVVDGVLATGMDGLMRQLARKRMAEEAAARRAERQRSHWWISPKWIEGRNALVTRTADDAWWLVSAYDTGADRRHRMVGTAKFGNKADVNAAGEAWTVDGEWRMAKAHTFTSDPIPEAAS